MTIKYALSVFAAFAAFASRADQNEIARYDPEMALKHIVVTNGVKWIDGRLIPMEGRAFEDVEHYYDRLPKNVTTNVNKGVRSMKHHTSGMQFRFSTDSQKLYFRWVPYKKSLSMDHMPATGVSGIDVYRLAPSGEWQYVKTGRIRNADKGGSLAIPWKKGDACLVNLPLYNGLKGFRLGIDEASSIKALPPRGNGVVKPVVFYGTSITHGGCASRPGLAYPSIVGRMLDVPIVNLGFSGSARCEFEMSDHLAAVDAGCYVIDSLWNMQYETVVERYEPFVRNLRAKRPDVPIILVEACYVYPEGNPRGPHNAFTRETYARLLSEGWKNLYLLPSKGQLGNDLEGTVDGVHPNDIGMMRMAHVFAPVVKKALGLK